MEKTLNERIACLSSILHENEQGIGFIGYDVSTNDLFVI